MEESTLYQKMKAGDLSAFNELFKLHYETLVRSTLLKVDEAFAEDLVQTVFIEFWSKRNDINIEGSVVAYLRKTVHNRCIDHFRKQKSIQQKEERYFQNTLSLSISDPESRLLSRESLSAIYDKIEDLPPKCKIVFKLSRFEEMTYDEIAQELDISKKTVEYHISTALQILRKTIFISFLIYF